MPPWYREDDNKVVDGENEDAAPQGKNWFLNYM